MDRLSTAANIATLAAFALACWSYARLLESTKDHLEVHLAAVRTWAVGPQHTGWGLDVVRAQHLIDWVHPRFGIVPMGVGAGFAQLTGLENFVLSREMRRAVVALVISIDALNSYLAEIQAFETADVGILVRVATKITAIYGTQIARDGVVLTPGELTLNRILQPIDLTDDERAWALHRGDMVARAHWLFIGNDRGRGVYRRLRELEEVMRREGLFREFRPSAAEHARLES